MTRQRILYHVEARHVASPGYRCEYCDKVCPNRNSYVVHKSRNHRHLSLLSSL
jgi:uncharacterized C2H2 Zn-finger protein